MNPAFVTNSGSLPLINDFNEVPRLTSKKRTEGLIKFPMIPVIAFRVSLYVVLGLCCTLTSCQKSEKILLTIDYSHAPDWTYMLGLDIKGTIAAPDSSREFTSSLRTYLTGDLSPHDSNAVQFKSTRPLITSNFLSVAERLHLERQCENLTLHFSPNEGAVTLSDTTRFTLFNVGNWDLFKSFARVLPVLPEQPQKIGAVWDRDRIFPLETTAGNAFANLFQSFSFDSLTTLDSLRCACISWRFTYRIEPVASDSLSKLAAMPLRGSGTGSARIDIQGQKLINAHVFFEVPPLPLDPIAISLQETAHLELVK